MNNEKFLSGFVKAAEYHGFSGEEAMRLAKEAGILSGIGNFAKDMLWEPIKGIGTNGADMLGHIGKGQFGKAFGSGAKMLGNAGLTALNFVPAGGLGNLAVRGALRGGAALAKGTGGILARRAAATAAPAAVAPAATTAAKGAASAAGKVVKPPTVAPTTPPATPAPLPGAAPTPAPAPAAPAAPTAGTGLTNFGNKLTGLEGQFADKTKQLGSSLMTGLDATVGRAGAGAKNLYSSVLGRTGPLQAPYASPISGRLAGRPMTQAALPGVAGTMGYGHYSGIRDENDRIAAYMNQPGMEPLSTYETEFNRPY